MPAAARVARPDPGGSALDEPATVFREVVCPFCSLGCDDLEVAIEGSALRLVGPDCPVAAQGFGRVGDRAGPLVAGLPATVEAAIERAAELLRGSALPLFGGLGTDVAGMRAVLALAESTGGIVDHAGSRGLLANVRAMQDGGTVTATLAEVRNRADLVLVVATDVDAVAPRFAERCLAPTTGLFGPLRRELVHLGAGRAAAWCRGSALRGRPDRRGRWPSCAPSRPARGSRPTSWRGCRSRSWATSPRGCARPPTR